MNPETTKVWNEASSRAVAAAHAERRRVTIDPITRLEGHGKIDIFLDDQGDVESAYLQVPELRGFEVFSLGRPAEEMPQITSRICGVCPTAHHMAATKALDDLYQVEPPPAARKIRELVYNTFILEDHALHVYILGGPDFIVGPKRGRNNATSWAWCKRSASKWARKSFPCAAACARKNAARGPARNTASQSSTVTAKPVAATPTYGVLESGTGDASTPQLAMNADGKGMIVWQ